MDAGHLDGGGTSRGERDGGTAQGQRDSDGEVIWKEMGLGTRTIYSL